MPVTARLAALYFALFAYIGVAAPYLPLYFAARGFPAAEIALVLALGPLARTFAPAFWGWLADRSGARRGIVILSCAAMVGGFALLPFAAGFGAVVVLMALTNVLAAGGMPLLETITLASLASRGPGAGATAGGYGRVRAWGSVGFIVAVLATGAWLEGHAPDTLVALIVALCALALAVSLLLPAGRAASLAPPPDAPAPPPRARGTAALLLAAGFCMAVAHGALYAFYTLHLEREGYSTSTIGALWTAGVVAEIVLFLKLPALLRRASLRAVLVASFAAAALRFVAIGWGSASLAVLVAAQLLHALSFGAHHAASVAAVHRLFPEGAQARGQALFSSICYGAGGAAGTLLAGWIWAAGGAQAMFGAAAFAALVGGGFAFALRGARL